MALTAFLLLMLFVKEGIVTGERMIELGSWLSPGGNRSSWASSSGHFAFGFYPQGDGHAVGIWVVGALNPNTIVWTANRNSPPLSSNSTLTLNTTGLLIFRSGSEDQLLISSATSSASMLDSGNFVLYGENHTVFWQSFDHPTDTILGGQNLTSNIKLISSKSESDHSSGRYAVIMRYAGYLSAYPVNSPATTADTYWDTKWLSDDFDYLGLDVSGNLCLCVGSRCFNSQCLYHSPGKKSHNTSSIYRATLDVDGILRLYEHQLEANVSSHIQILWNTSLDKCQVKGVCGFNSYCSNATVMGNAVCECFPGFIPSKSRRNVNVSLPLDCVLAHSQDGCQSTEDQNTMNLCNITQLENVHWGDDSNSPYFVKHMNKEECERSFLEDCNCMAVLYSDSKCKKYRLPLIYGRRVQNASTVALFKKALGIVPSLFPNNSQQMPKPKLQSKVIVDNKKSLIMILAFALCFISLLSLLLTVIIFFTYKRKVYKYTTLYTSENLGFTEECSLRSFSFEELEKSTRGFTEEIGRGSFGAVYRGKIGDGNKSIAVKRLERIADEGEREFQTEITAIARTHHRNLVKLIGFCINGSRKLIVYEYVSNGSLASLLFKSEKNISWGERLKMALDIARGVLYLHEECEVRIIHCNIKPRNILMDEAWTAKISDFGLARLLKWDPSRMKKEDDETSNYLAPEWKKDGPISVKVDIYSFGMLLLEIVCRRHGIEMNVSSAEEILLSSWVYQCFEEGQLNKLVKDEGVDWMLLERMVKVGLWCVQDQPSLRPSIKNVILMLQGLKDIPIPPSPANLRK